MIEDWFKKNLSEMLPQMYALEDKSGDLATFLQLPAGALDEIKEAIDAFPDLFDVDRCEPRFLPLLGYLIGVQVDGTRTPRVHRRQIREAIETYRRKGTLPAMERDFRGLGWQGVIAETFRSAFRLNARPKLGQAKLPGQVYSLGVFQVQCRNQTRGLRQSLSFHHPAGTRGFWLQFMLELIAIGEHLDLAHTNWIRQTSMAYLDESLMLGRAALGSCRHLTAKQKAFHRLSLTSTTLIEPQTDHATIKVARFHGRQRGRMRLNQRPFGHRMVNTHVNQDRVSFCTPIYTGQTYDQDVLNNSFTLGIKPLNQRAISGSNSDLLYCFRQKDFLGQGNSPPPEDGGTRLHFRFTGHSQLREVLQLGRSPLVGRPLNGPSVGLGKRQVTLISGSQAEVRLAVDRIDRWQRRAPVFQLNGQTLNGRSLTNVVLTEERAALEVDGDTGSLRRHRVSPVKLGASPLNRTGLRLSVDRTRPLRLSRMPLNQAGFRLSDPAYRWLIRPSAG